MKLSHFKYKLPQELIATHPLKDRDASRLMVINRKEQTIEHKQFKDILEYFGDQDTMIFNNTQVFPARMYGQKEKTGAKIEVFLLRELDAESKLWDVLVDPARKIRIGNKLYFGENDDLVAEVIDNTTSRGRTLRFLYDGTHAEFRNTLFRLGSTPIPKYLGREAEKEDEPRYQSLFAKREGAVAAPVSSLHFSRELLKRLEIKGVNFAEITLHIGLSGFKEVEVEDLTKHKMESEELYISEKAASIVNKSKELRKNVCIVGTSVAKAVESSVSTQGLLKPYSGWTNKFIFPPYTFQVPNRMLCNFYRAETTPLMTVAAFVGDVDFLMKAYNEAIKEKYRFLSYGDAMLII